MKYDNSHNDMNERIFWDYSSSFASDSQQLKHQAFLAQQAYEKENKELHEKHAQTNKIDIWASIL